MAYPAFRKGSYPQHIPRLKAGYLGPQGPVAGLEQPRAFRCSQLVGRAVPTRGFHKAQRTVIRDKKPREKALGAFDYVPWTHHEDPTDAVTHVRKAGIPVVAIETADHAKSLGGYEWSRPIAVVFGNEVKGITPELLSQCDEIVRIPMLGYKNSINVATAFGIVLYDILGQWGALREPAATAAPRNRTPAPCPGEDQ